jgi:type IV secretion system protein TrbL
VNNLSVIDHFTEVFSHYIDSGFGLLGGEVSFLTATLVAIDVTLAGLFWAMGGTDEVIGKLIKKVLYVGTFAFILTNFNQLAAILFHSFAGLGLTATGTTLTEGEFLQPGHLASVGVDAARPLLTAIGQLAGFPDVFLNLETIAVLFLAWLIVIVSFFVLAVQLFVTLIEFKLTTLAGFVLVPFALWNKTAFLAERVLGNVVASGIKILVLAVIVGIGTGIFGEFTQPPGTDPTIDTALALMLASLALFGLGIFGPGIATGLVSGAPQLGAGAAAGTVLAAGGLAAAGGAAVIGGASLASRLPGAAAGGLRSATSLAQRTGSAVSTAVGSMRALGVSALDLSGRGTSSGASTGAVGASATRAAGRSASAGPASPAAQSTPPWAKQLERRQQIARGVSAAAHTVRGADRGGSGAHPSLRQEN